MKNMMKIVMPLAVGALLTTGAQAQTKIAIEGQAYVITGTAASGAGSISYQWYRNNVPISECTAATCTVPANLCNGASIVFKRKVVVTGSNCAGDTEGFTNEVTVTFKCGGGHGTKIGSLCWADRNVGAAGAFTATAHEYSPFYKWNSNKAWAATGNVADWNTTQSSSSTWTVSPHPCPAGWRLPTISEFSALSPTNGSSTWAIANAKGNTVAGRFFGSSHAACSFATGNMSGCIFLPACGNHSYSSNVPNSQGSVGFYWNSQEVYEEEFDTYNGGTFQFSTGGVSASSLNSKSAGQSIRCVQ